MSCFARHGPPVTWLSISSAQRHRPARFAAYRASKEPPGHCFEGVADRFRGALRHGQGARTLRADVHERPRRYRSEASRGSLRHKRLVAEDQKPRLLAERGAADRAYGRLVVEIKRLVPAPGVGSGWRPCENTGIQSARRKSF